MVAAWPATGTMPADPGQLRERMLASAGRPYQGYVATVGRLGLPAVPERGGLLGGPGRIRAWYASRTAWRVAELTPNGERDTYRTAAGTYGWDFERNVVTYVEGEQVIWLPGAPDVVPPALARRLLGGDGRLSALPVRQVAGVRAPGVRLTPTDVDSTVGRVDVWADPSSGLPVQVEVSARGATDPAYTSRFLELRQTAPDAAVLAPPRPAGAGFAATTSDDVNKGLATALSGRLPATLAGRARTSTIAKVGISGAAAYGTGFSTVVVLPLPGRYAWRTLAAARDGGGTPVNVTGAKAYGLRASLLAALVVRPDGDRLTRRGWLIVGLVDPDLLRRAATELVGTT